ncbi:MAG: glycoside hydrolase family 5 protein [Spirochaetes bacterium]|nr:glycoside hydrolase family 5 protein [Spirochaetota bacterium]
MNKAFRLFFIILANLSIMFSFNCGGSGSESDSEEPYDIPEESYYEAPLNPIKGNFSQSAKTLVSDMKYGWNLGNTLDAHSETNIKTDYEVYWSQPKTTQSMVNGIKTSGLKTVRIPVSWHNHVNEAFTIDKEWIERVQEVVDYGINSGLYVIVNIHHDNSEKWYFPNDYHSPKSQAFVSRIWKQIALRFRNYDEHLIFEFLNEPRLTGYTNEWNWNDSDENLSEAADNINELNQLAIDTIRATGGNNDKRFVMIAPYVASPWAALSSKFKMPEDSASDKLILSVHAYTPYNFAMKDPGTAVFSDSAKSEIDSFMSRLNNKFISSMNIPVVIGEYGATNKNNLDERMKYFTYYVSKAHSYGMCPIVWDNGNYQIKGSSYAELYGYYNRTDQSWYFPDLLNTIISN